jgi:hypothetical protein
MPAPAIESDKTCCACRLQECSLQDIEAELRTTLVDAEGCTRTLRRWRIASAAATLRFVDALGG